MTTKARYEIIPYQREDRDIYAGLEFDPNHPEPLPEAMYQERILREIAYLLTYYLTDTPGRSDVLVSSNTFLCYDRSNLNRYITPDCYVALGVDEAAIRSRRLYLPWEAGKPPDLALEMASESTADDDTGDKRRLYESIGVGEYWRFDATGGDYYGEPLVGERLVDGRYQRMEITRQPDGALRGYSPTLDLYLVWQPQPDGEGWLYLYDPATGQRLRPLSHVRRSEAAAIADAADARADADAARSEVAAANDRADAAEGRADAAIADAADARADAADARADAADARAEAADANDRANAADEEIRSLREQIRRLLGR